MDGLAGWNISHIGTHYNPYSYYNYIISPGLLRRVIARAHLHTLHVLSRCAINTRLAKFLPYYAHLEIKLFARKEELFCFLFLNNSIK